MARALGISRSTLYEWRVAHPEFSDAIRGAKGLPIERVERALYHRAVGYTHDAVKIVNNDGEIVAVQYEEHVPPDVNAIRLWLLNCDPLRWRDRHEIPREKDSLPERELTLEEIERRLDWVDEQRRKLLAIEGEATVVSAAKDLVPAK